MKLNDFSWNWIELLNNWNKNFTLNYTVQCCLPCEPSTTIFASIAFILAQTIERLTITKKECQLIGAKLRLYLASDPISPSTIRCLIAHSIVDTLIISPVRHKQTKILFFDISSSRVEYWIKWQKFSITEKFLFVVHVFEMFAFVFVASFQRRKSLLSKVRKCLNECQWICEKHDSHISISSKRIRR